MLLSLVFCAVGLVDGRLVVCCVIESGLFSGMAAIILSLNMNVITVYQRRKYWRLSIEYV